MPVTRRARNSVSDRAAMLIAESDFGRRLVTLRTEFSRRRAPLHWTNMFGIVTLACVVVLFFTGFILMFWYSPSSAATRYGGPYAPLDGITVSHAFDSAMHISFGVPGGLLVRQAHHWAALLLPASVIMQLLVTFFTGAFRRPRRLAWLFLFSVLVVGLIGGWSGYALPDDMLSGTGLRIVEGLVLGIPFIGTWLSALLFGGEFPGQIIEHLYPVHVLVIPAVLILLLILRARLAYLNKPAQFPGPGRTENVIVGVPVYPQLATRAVGLLFIIIALLVLFSATVTVSPIWLYGPSSPADASAGSQPDWYTGFLDGALRLVPPEWEASWLGRTWTLYILIPLGVVTIFLAAVAFYPFLEEWITGDHEDHNLLERPRNSATRTGFGMAGIVFYAALWGAGSADIIATHFQLSVETVVHLFQATALLGPFVAFGLTRRVCLALQKKDQQILLHGYETGRIVRLPGGEYIELHSPIAVEERATLAGPPRTLPLQANPNQNGRLRRVSKIRERLSRFFFEYRIDPVTPKEMAAVADLNIENEPIETVNVKSGGEA